MERCSWRVQFAIIHEVIMQPNRMPWLLMMTLRRAAVYTYDNTLIFTSAMAKKSFIMPMPNMKNYTWNSHNQYEHNATQCVLARFLSHCFRIGTLHYEENEKFFNLLSPKHWRLQVFLWEREQTCIQNSQIFFTNYSMHFIISVVLCLLNTQSLNDPMREAHTHETESYASVCVCLCAFASFFPFNQMHSALIRTVSSFISVCWLGTEYRFFWQILFFMLGACLIAFICLFCVQQCVCVFHGFYSFSRVFFSLSLLLYQLLDECLHLRKRVKFLLTEYPIVSMMQIYRDRKRMNSHIQSFLYQIHIVMYRCTHKTSNMRMGKRWWNRCECEWMSIFDKRIMCFPFTIAFDRKKIFLNG